MSDAVSKTRVAAVLLVNVIWIQIPCDAGEQIDIRLADRLGDPCPKPNWDVVDRPAAHFSRPIAYHHALPALMPPSTYTVCPVMKRAASEARNSTTSATSSGWPRRRSGVLAIAASTRSGNSSM